MNVIGHFRTVCKHRFLVMQGCFHVGLIWQGLTHDLSKFSPTEFRVGARYYQGSRSPNTREREENGYSLAWMHHKGRNRHHFEYWTDLKPGTRVYSPVEMPPRYLAEMVMDRIAACKTYQGKAYTDAAPITYLEAAKETPLMHPATMRKLRYLLSLLRDKGERELYRFIRETVLRGQPFAEEETVAE